MEEDELTQLGRDVEQGTTETESERAPAPQPRPHTHLDQATAQAIGDGQLSQEDIIHAAVLEQMAHGATYEGVRNRDLATGVDAGETDARGRQQMLVENGYNPIARVVTGENGFEMVVYEPLVQGSGVAPVVSFRGTSSAGDLITDTDVQVGQRQYEANQELVAREMARVSADYDHPVEVTGHSLGGSLAQVAAARNPGCVASITTFQSPGVDQSEVDLIDAENQRRAVLGEAPIRADHFRVVGDVVPMAGEAHADGDVHMMDIEHGDRAIPTIVSPSGALLEDTVMNEVENHTAHPLTSLALQTERGRAALPGILAPGDNATYEGTSSIEEADAAETVDVGGIHIPVNVGGVNLAEEVRAGAGHVVRGVEAAAISTDQAVESAQERVERMAAATDQIVDGTQADANQALRSANRAIDRGQRGVERSVDRADSIIDRGQQIAAPVMGPASQLAVDASQEIVHRGLDGGAAAVDLAQSGSRAVSSVLNDGVDATQDIARHARRAGNRVIDDVQGRAHEAWDWLHS